MIRSGLTYHLADTEIIASVYIVRSFVAFITFLISLILQYCILLVRHSFFFFSCCNSSIDTPIELVLSSYLNFYLSLSVHLNVITISQLLYLHPLSSLVIESKYCTYAYLCPSPSKSLNLHQPRSSLADSAETTCTL